MLTHTIRNGESIWQLAKEYRINLDALVAANPQITDPNYILPGSKINLPNFFAATEEQITAEKLVCKKTKPELTDDNGSDNCGNNADRPLIYITQDGETLYNISTRFQLPVAQLHYHNYQYSQNKTLPGGERIIVPADAAIQIQGDF